MTERIRGRRGVALRRRRLAAEPLCRECNSKEIITPSTVPGHVQPLALSGEDVDSNIRCLCGPCHDAWTAEQFGYRKQVETGLDGCPGHDQRSGKSRMDAMADRSDATDDWRRDPPEGMATLQLTSGLLKMQRLQMGYLRVVQQHARGAEGEVRDASE